MASKPEEIVEEIEALQAIMMDEVNVHYNQSGQPKMVEITVKPATAQNIEQQHVRVMLVVTLPVHYPDEPPTITLKNPRGIDDDVLEVIKVESVKKCEEYIGLPVIYELIELVREKLTANNTPSCPCAICLFHFTDNDLFTKTPCFHYFHSYCLGRYIMNCEAAAAAEEKENQQPIWMTREKRELLCPVCREPLNDEMNGRDLLRNPPPEEGELMKDFNPASPEVRALQDKMMSLYLHQKSKGGIIDLEEEKNKFLISAAVNHIESLERDPSLMENGEESVSHRKETAAKQKSSKGGSHGSSKRGGINQTGRRENNSNWWNSGNKNRNHRKGNRNVGCGRSNTHHMPSSESCKIASPCQGVANSGKKFPRQQERHERCSHQTPRNVENSEVSVSQEAQNYLTSHPDDSKKKVGRSHLHRHSFPTGGGGPSKGTPPPGISELERSVRSEATS